MCGWKVTLWSLDNAWELLWWVCLIKRCDGAIASSSIPLPLDMIEGRYWALHRMFLPVLGSISDTCSMIRILIRVSTLKLILNTSILNTDQYWYLIPVPLLTGRHNGISLCSNWEPRLLLPVTIWWALTLFSRMSYSFAATDLGELVESWHWAYILYTLCSMTVQTSLLQLFAAF